MKAINVLSLFDGMSCGQIALNRAGIKVNKYYASEIDKFAIKVTQANYPNTIQIGDVTKVNWFGLPKIDLLIAGSPCQGFSFAGKKLNFNDERSKLFFEFVRILKEVKPQYFLLENVVMKKEYQDIISQLLGVEPIKINSSLVSAQNRNRLYWTNISDIKMPHDKGIVLKDIIESENIIFNKNVLNSNKCIQISEANLPTSRKQDKRVYSIYGKSPCLLANTGGHKEPKIAIYQRGRGFNKGGMHFNKSTSMTANCWQENNFLIHDENWRKLTPLECERLQTVDDNYTNHVSNSQRYKMLGNGWTVDIIKHIFSFMKF